MTQEHSELLSQSGFMKSEVRDKVQKLRRKHDSYEFKAFALAFPTASTLSSTTISTLNLFIHVKTSQMILKSAQCKMQTRDKENYNLIIFSLSNFILL